MNTSKRNIAKPSPDDFGRAIRAIQPRGTFSSEQLTDWRRRVALAALSQMGMRVGSAASVAFLLAAGV